jgi:hypothetical protein
MSNACHALQQKIFQEGLGTQVRQPIYGPGLPILLPTMLYSIPGAVGVVPLREPVMPALPLSLAYRSSGA